MAAEGEEVAATMNDIKEMTSSMDKRMDEMREMIASLINVQAAAPSASSPTEDPLTGNKPVDNEEDGGESASQEKDNLPKKPPSSESKNGKEEFHAVPQATLPTHLSPILILTT